MRDFFYWSVDFLGNPQDAINCELVVDAPLSKKFVVFGVLWGISNSTLMHSTTALIGPLAFTGLPRES